VRINIFSSDRTERTGLDAKNLTLIYFPERFKHASVGWDTRVADLHDENISLVGGLTPPPPLLAYFSYNKLFK